MIANFPVYDGVGIYKLVDDLGRVYVGSAVNVSRRIKQHDQYARHGKEIKTLQSAFNEGRLFTAHVLEELPPDTNHHQLMTAERQHLIKIKEGCEVYNHFLPRDTLKNRRHQNYEKWFEPLRPDLIERVEDPEEE